VKDLPEKIFVAEDFDRGLNIRTEDSELVAKAVFDRPRRDNVQAACDFAHALAHRFNTHAALVEALRVARFYCEKEWLTLRKAPRNGHVYRNVRPIAVRDLRIIDAALSEADAAKGGG